MTSFINVLSNAVLAKDFADCGVEELRDLAVKHPYASTVQFLFTQKLVAVEDQDAQHQLQKLLLHYSNPLFINYLINSFKAETQQNNADVPTETELAIIQPEEVVTTEPAPSPEVPLAAPDPVKSKSLFAKGDTLVQLKPEVGESVDVFETSEDEAAFEAEDLPPLPAFKIESIDPAVAQLSFTPYYTVDYFAAQGIKLGTVEPNTEDRFGVQLKSFTTWLKHMKRLPGATTKTNITLKEEKNIEQLAVESLTGENADTEAMAEVWAKQGNIKKAIEVYKKLSLQIPTKSAYFAAKIDFLKK